MRLDRIDGDLLRRAVSIFVDEAYGDSKPRRRLPDLSGVNTVEDACRLLDDESRLQRGAITARRWVLRIGNSRYPNMKLVLEEYMLAGEFVFGVDTHDDVVLLPGAPDAPEWAELRRWNKAVKDRIEARWRQDGVPTYATLLERLRQVDRPPDGPPRADVLVVDDEAAIADTVEALLLGEGYSVRKASDGAQALERVQESLPDLILMDFEMPQMTGTEACSRLKAAKATRDVPVLLATAAMVDLASLADADGFLVKPYQRNVLLSFVGALARKRTDSGSGTAGTPPAGEATGRRSESRPPAVRKSGKRRRRPPGA